MWRRFVLPGFVLLLACGLAACGHPAPAPVAAPATPIVPVEVVIPALVPPPDAGYMWPYVDRLYALGWSADSTRFAYAIQRADEACGCLTVDLAIASVDGGESWHDQYQGDEQVPGSTEPVDFPALWTRRGAAWSADLRARGIERPPTATLVPLPVGGDAFPQVTIKSTAVGDDSTFGFAYLTRYEVAMSRGGEPSVMADFDANGGIGPQQVEVAGYVEAPDRLHRIGLILETWRGWEGQQQVVTVRVVPAAS